MTALHISQHCRASPTPQNCSVRTEVPRWFFFGQHLLIVFTQFVSLFVFFLWTWKQNSTFREMAFEFIKKNQLNMNRCGTLHVAKYFSYWQSFVQKVTFHAKKFDLWKIGSPQRDCADLTGNIEKLWIKRCHFCNVPCVSCSSSLQFSANGIIIQRPVTSRFHSLFVCLSSFSEGLQPKQISPKGLKGHDLCRENKKCGRVSFRKRRGNQVDYLPLLFLFVDRSEIEATPLRKDAVRAYPANLWDLFFYFHFSWNVSCTKELKIFNHTNTCSCKTPSITQKQIWKTPPSANETCPKEDGSRKCPAVTCPQGNKIMEEEYVSILSRCPSTRVEHNAGVTHCHFPENALRVLASGLETARSLRSIQLMFLRVTLVSLMANWSSAKRDQLNSVFAFFYQCQITFAFHP